MLRCNLVATVIFERTPMTKGAWEGKRTNSELATCGVSAFIRLLPHQLVHSHTT